MGWITETARRLGSIVGRGTREARLDDELRFHVEQQTEKNRRAGSSDEEARRQAMLRFGAVERTREAMRDEFRAVRLEDLWRDVRAAVRALWHAPAMSGVAVLTLALGIGASTAIFSLVDNILIKPLPYPDADALVVLTHTAPGVNLPRLALSATQYFSYRKDNRTFDRMGLLSTSSVTVTADGESSQALAGIVNSTTLPTLGVAPVLGRTFTDAEDAPGSPETAILSHRYWASHFRSDPAILGRAVTVDGRPRQIVGVMPQGFRLPEDDPDLFVPFRFDQSKLFLSEFNYTGIARLKPGVSLSAANADVARMIPRWLNEWPTYQGLDRSVFVNARVAPTLQTLKHDVIGDVASVLWLLLGTISIVWLVACANVANLLLVRTDGRQHELAIRASLGAGWARIARELLLESLVLGIIGGGCGVALAAAGLKLFVAVGPASLPRLADVTVDARVLAFAAVISVTSALLFGLLPALRYSRPRLGTSLRMGGRTASASRERRRARDVLVVVQVALAVVLLVASGLMARTFIALRHVQPGFANPEHVALVRLAFPGHIIASATQVLRAQRDVVDAIAAIPGVTSVSYGTAAPMEPYDNNDAMFSADHPVPAGTIPAIRRFKFQAPGFFGTVGTPLVAGRDFSWDDLEGLRPVAVVSDNLAREVWGTSQAAIGKLVRENPASPWREVVGVVGDVRDNGVDKPAPPTVYWPAMMATFWNDSLRVERSVTIAVRTDRAGSDALASEIRTRVRGAHAGLPLLRMQTLREVYQSSLARTSFALTMLGLAAGMALTLGLIGIYGVLSYAVTQRRREIGLRLALGAQNGELQRMFVRQGVVLSVIGACCGLVAAAALARTMTSMLFGTGTLDPTTYAGVAASLVAAAALASYLPALKATRIDPMIALRADGE